MQDLNLGPSRIAVFEDCKVTALTIQPLRVELIITLLEEDFIFPSFSVPWNAETIIS